jgi:hypothetical protein
MQYDHVTILTDDEGREIAKNYYLNGEFIKTETIKPASSSPSSNKGPTSAACLKTNNAEEAGVVKAVLAHMFDKMGEEKTTELLSDLDRKGLRLVDVLTEADNQDRRTLKVFEAPKIDWPKVNQPFEIRHGKITRFSDGVEYYDPPAINWQKREE